MGKSVSEIKAILVAELSEKCEIDAVCEVAKINVANGFTMLAEALSELHNERVIDFVRVVNDSLSGSFEHKHFLLLRVFNAALPDLTSGAADVIECIDAFHKLDESVKFSGIYGAFESFCKISKARRRDALEYIFNDVERLYYFLAPVVVSASESDPEWVFDQVNKLSKNIHSDVRRQAYLIISSVKSYSDFSERRLWSFLAFSFGNEEDSLAKSYLLRAILRYVEFLPLDWPKVIELLNDFDPKNEREQSIELLKFLSYEGKGMPDDVYPFLIRKIKGLPLDDADHLNLFDQFASKMIRAGYYAIAEDLIKSAIKNNKEVSFKSLDSCCRSLIVDSKSFLNKIVTKWFLLGDIELCKFISDWLVLGRSESLILNGDSSCFHYDDDLLFACRKAVGWLFNQPVSAASFILSLYLSASVSAKEYIEDLIFDPLLISFPGSLGDFLKDRSAESKYREVSSCLLARLKDYQESLSFDGDFKELRAPQENIQLYRDRMDRNIDKARQESPPPLFEELCAVKHLLYGNGSISYVQSESGEMHRSEAKMQTISHSMELPALAILDPEGLDHRLKVFRVERWSYEADT